MRRPRREPWSFWCILKCSVNEPMRSLSNAIWTSGLPVSVACVPYWSMRDFFCSLASTNLVRSCLIFQLFCNAYEVNTLPGGCKDSVPHESCGDGRRARPGGATLRRPSRAHQGIQPRAPHLSLIADRPHWSPDAAKQKFWNAKLLPWRKFGAYIWGKEKCTPASLGRQGRRTGVSAPQVRIRSLRACVELRTLIAALEALRHPKSDPLRGLDRIWGLAATPREKVQTPDPSTSLGMTIF